MTNLYLLRHGESRANITGTISCRLPGPNLTSRGVEQIKTIASKKIKTINFPKIYCSPFQRTVETAILITKESVDPGELIIDRRIQEINYGFYEGLTKKDKGDLVALTLGRILRGDNSIRFGVYGENEKEIITRIVSFLKDVIRERKDTLVVSHQGIISIILQIRNLIDGTKIKDIIDSGFFYKVLFTESDIRFLNKYIRGFKDSYYSPYTLIHGNYVSKTEFYPSVDLVPDLPITTPFTFPFYKDKVVLAYDKMGWWNPLGGHIEQGESWQEALIRESKEEAGIKIKDIKIVGYILIERLIEGVNPKYPGISIIPVTKSTVAEYMDYRMPRETKKRGLFSVKDAIKVFKKRTDNSQMLEVFNYIIKYCL